MISLKRPKTGAVLRREDLGLGDVCDWAGCMVVVFGGQTILRTSVQWKLFGDSLPWVAVGLLTSLGILHSYGPTSTIWGDSLS